MGGRRNTVEEQQDTLHWAETLSISKHELPNDFDLATVKESFRPLLRSYFALCGLSRHKYAPAELRSRACDLVFKVRVSIEKCIISSLLDCIRPQLPSIPRGFFRGSFYGSSKKQGVSVRMPLSTCNPTSLCASKCYAHDALDAAPEAVLRGAVNGAIAQLYETSDLPTRQDILGHLCSHTRKAVKTAVKEVECLSSGWTREPYIRFAHVGEMPAVSTFANAMAQQVKDVSDNRVQCVVYTRHPSACRLDESLWIVNFTLDKSSEERRSWAPPHCRLVFSAFDGHTSDEVEINFLEHHPWSHESQKGFGNVCPATAPAASDRTCDGQECDRCFVPISTLAGASHD